MGAVYEAVDHRTGQRIALKLLREIDPDSVLRFKEEFRRLTDLAHPNLVRLGELFEEAGRWYFTMELVRGRDFIEHVRPQLAPVDAALSGTLETIPGALLHADFDEGRLRAGLEQLCGALQTLHAAGLVHRDIKPSNILVDSAGRLVLLDFGLITTEHSQISLGGAHALVGTPAYMSPEQAAQQPVSASSDWYSVGVLLYQALTGELPHDGPVLQVLADKQCVEPRAPATIVPGIPADLSRLCQRLLAFSPRERAGAAEVLACARPGTRRAIPATGTLSVASSFVGRQGELAALEAALARCAAGASEVVLIRGVSGIGKSAVVQHFIERLQRRPAVQVFSGRCYEREAIPFKAFDAMIDAISRFASRLPQAEVEALVPMHCAALTQVFPVLARVRAFAQAAAGRRQPRDPHELRERLFSAMRELLALLARRYQIVLFIDDLQWADDDSMALLSALVSPPDPPRFLLLSTQRADAPLPPITHRLLEVGPLAADEARELARRSCLQAASTGELHSIVAEAAGHPLFIMELAHHMGPGLGERGTKLDDALWLRAQQLDSRARTMLELLCLAGGPLSQHTLLEAAELVPEVFQRLVALLKVGRFVRTRGSRGSDAIEPYHDRVREAVVARLDGTTLQARHAALASAMTSTGHADLEAIAHHYRCASDAVRAHEFTVRAAERAASVLAFDRAAQLYRMALAGAPAEEERRLRLSCAEALASAGRGREAAELFLQSVPGAAAAETLELRRRACEQLLISGHIDAGLAALREVLAAVNLRLPATPGRALLGLLARRAQLAGRGLRFQARDTSQIAADQLTRVDVCWSAGIGLAMVDNIRGAHFQVRHLLLALAAGDVERISLGVALEACFCASRGTQAARRVEYLLSRVRELAQRAETPRASAWAALAEGVCAVLFGRWRAGQEHLGVAETLMRDHCAGVAWELNSAHLFILFSHYHMGQISELRRAVAQRLRQAEARGDLYALTNFRAGFASFVHLADHDPGAARASASEAMERWSKDGFHMQHLYFVHTHASSDLYEGRVDAAVERLQTVWPTLRRTLLLRVHAVRVMVHDLYARAWLAAAAVRPERRAQTAARHHLGVLGRTGSVASGPMAMLIRAGLARCDGDDETAARLLERAAAGFDEIDMTLHGAVARYRLGQLRGGSAGEELRSAALSWMRSQEIREPGRIVELLAPGFR
jgi:hypothetical protein